MNTILVTGSSGFIGSALVNRLGDVQRLDIKDGQDLLGHALSDYKGVETVIHLAAMPLVPMSVQQPEYTFRHNVMATLNVLEFCRSRGASLIFASSSQAELDAKNPYALQKHQCEQWIRLYTELYGLKAVVLRLHNVFGPGGHTVVETFLERRKQGLPLIIKGGEQRRDFIHIDAVAEALEKALKMEPGTYEVGTGDNTSVQEIADMMVRQEHEPLPVGEPLHLVSKRKVKSISVKEYLS